MSEQKSSNNNILDQAVAEGGAYEVIRKRLLEQGKKLKHQTHLNLKTIAEGVETVEQLNMLVAKECDEIQPKSCKPLFGRLITI